ncbi:hypothetical protein WJX72_006345 [[Myrmecia] bisecta]|uniref:Uncharacterized protein n=1 Tax=[Myrmecia] bisecta TaxID=41462 RepID=A0AAW1PH13_9CHLO
MSVDRFAVNSPVEVSGVASEGFPASFAVGRVVELEHPAANSSNIVPKCTVAYTDFVSEDNQPLLEVFSVRSNRLRPAPPASCYRSAFSHFRVGQAVEVWDNDCWWQGYIIHLTASEARVHFPDVDGGVRPVHNITNMRTSMEWKHGAWHSRIPTVIPAVSQKANAKAVAVPDSVKLEASAPPAAVPERLGTAFEVEVGAEASAGGSAAPANVRRTTRVVKSRIMMIGDQPVLKANNYDIEDGEQSVFEQELKRKAKTPGRASGSAAGPMGSGWVTFEREPPKSAPAAPKARAVSLIDQNRHAHNERVRADARAAEGRRAMYLQRHLDVIMPFASPSAVAHIQAKARVAAAHDNGERPEPVEFQPEAITGKMREYQLEGLKWMVSCFDHGINAILADEMGLGKTLQTISFLTYLKDVRKVEGPSLVVVPLSVLPSWMNELRRWAPSMRVVRAHTNDIEERKRIRREVLADPSSFDVAVTTYEMVLSQSWSHTLCHTVTWRYLVLDEGHKIKNEHTNVSQAMRHIGRQNVLLLTGTPMQNNLHELYALLNFLYPDVFTDPSIFDNAFDLAHHKVDNDKLEAAHRLLKPFCLRRLKEEVEKSLPPRVETRINCPLSAMQTFWYRRLLLKDSKMLHAVEAEFGNTGIKYEKENDSWRKLQALVMQLRKCCNHPYLFPGAEPDFDGVNTGEDLIEAGGKMGVLDRMLAKLKARGHRVTLFSQYNRMLDIIEDFLIMRGYKYVRMDGSTNRVQRMIDMQMFNKPNSDIFIYILNTRAGGLGVNLQTADTCILYDSDWNPQWDLQAMARVHRIGQTRPCHVYRFCTAGTVEERVQQRAEKKLYLDQMVNRGAVAAVEDMESLSKGELLSMLRFGADRIFKNSEGAAPTDAELDHIIDRSASLATTVGTGAGVALKADGGEPVVSATLEKSGSGNILSEKLTAASFDAEEVPLSTCILNGEDYSEVRAVKDIAAEFWAGRQRERKQRLITIDGFQVLKENNYELLDGEPSIFARETKPLVGEKKSKRQMAGKDYGHSDLCQVCWDGGVLVCCDDCPAAYHADCLGLDQKELEGKQRWSCPHHRCSECDRGTAAAGGLLFRCQTCSAAFCEDHMPPDAEILMHCARFQALGQIHPKQACFIHCCEDCKSFAEATPSVFDRDTLIQAGENGTARIGTYRTPAPKDPPPPTKVATASGRSSGRRAAKGKTGVKAGSGVGKRKSSGKHACGQQAAKPVSGRGISRYYQPLAKG